MGLLTDENRRACLRRALLPASRKVFVLVLLWAAVSMVALGQHLPPAAASQFRRAIEYMRAQQYEPAEQALRQLARRFPSHSDIEEALAIVLDLQGKIEDATPHFELAVKGNPASAQAHVNLGANYFRRGRLDAAQREFQAALKLRPDDATLHFNLGTLYLRQKKFQKALPHLEQAHQRQPEIFENSFQLALCYFFLRQHEKAGQLLDELAPRAGERGEFLLLRGLNQKALGRDDEARNSLRRALETIPSSSEVLATVGEMFFELGYYAEAIPLFERAHKQNPDSYEAAFNLARAYQGAGQFPQARAIAQETLARRPTADLHHLLGEVNEQLADYVEAVQHLQQAAELEPCERNLYDLGYEFLAHWSWDAAVAVFEKGLQRFPKSERLWLGIATAYYGQGDYNRAVESLLQATAIAPDNEMAYRLLIAAFPFSHGFAERVQQRLRQFETRHPDSSWANYCYALALWQNPDRPRTEPEVAKATRLLERAVSLAPDRAEANYQLGVLLSEQRQWSKAIPALEAAVRLKPDYVEAHYRLALAYQRVGKTEEAQAALARYVKLKEKQDSELDLRTSQTAKFVYSIKP